MKFRILIQGENFLLSVEGAPPRKYGFYVTAHVEAASTDQAEALAFHHLRNYDDLRNMVRNSSDDRPRLRVDETESITDWPAEVARPLTGLSIYEED